MMWLLATTGLRVGECCALSVCDVDSKRGRVRVSEAKTHAGVRDVAVSANVVAMLDLQRPDRCRCSPRPTVAG